MRESFEGQPRVAQTSVTEVCGSSYPISGFTADGITSTNPNLKEAILDTPLLGDKAQFPTDKVIFSHIGKSKLLWVSLFRYIAEAHPDFTKEWRYYNDGKQWLMKVQHKKKTVFWLSVIKGSFRTTFYIHEKAAKIVQDSKISEELKKQFRTGKGYGQMRIRGVTVVYRSKKDVESAKELIGIKLSSK